MTIIDDVYTHTLFYGLIPSAQTKADALSELKALFVFGKQPFKCATFSDISIARAQTRQPYKDEVESRSANSRMMFKVKFVIQKFPWMQFSQH